LYTVDLALAREQHHAIVEAIGALLRGEAGDIGSPHFGGAIIGYRPAIVEASLGQRVL